MSLETILIKTRIMKDKLTDFSKSHPLLTQTSYYLFFPLSKSIKLLKDGIHSNFYPYTYQEEYFFGISGAKIKKAMNLAKICCIKIPLVLAFSASPSLGVYGLQCYNALTSYTKENFSEKKPLTTPSYPCKGEEISQIERPTVYVNLDNAFPFAKNNPELAIINLFTTPLPLNLFIQPENTEYGFSIGYKYQEGTKLTDCLSGVP
jgi:hypothetical protein